MSTFDLQKIRAQFPCLHIKAHEHPLAYLDNAATTQKPKIVIDTITNYYKNSNANVHRGVHTLSEIATEQYEGTRKFVQQYINAKTNKEIIFTRGTTESINLVASCFAKAYLKDGDEIIITELEHHSNLVPWQHLAKHHNITLKVLPINDLGELCIEQLDTLLSNKTKLVAVGFASNALGTLNPVKNIITKAHEVGAKVLIDGAQAIPHCKIDVQDLNCDFFAFSGHKAFGPTGVGVLYAKQNILEKFPPYQYGGDMILKVDLKETIYNDLPYKFEAGTPNIAGVIGLGAALKFLAELDFTKIEKHEQQLLKYATEKLSELKDIRIIGTSKHKVPITTFVMDDIHPHDIGSILDQYGIAIRTGHHCAMPVMAHFNIPATSRASFAFYNTFEEVDRLITGLKDLRKIFKL